MNVYTRATRANARTHARTSKKPFQPLPNPFSKLCRRRPAGEVSDRSLEWVRVSASPIASPQQPLGEHAEIFFPGEKPLKSIVRIAIKGLA